MRRCEIAGRGPSRDEGSAVQDIASLSAAASLGCRGEWAEVESECSA